MKKTLSILAVLGVMCFGLQSAEAFSWSNLNPAYWGHCNKCEKPKKECGCKKKKKCGPCEQMTGGASPCTPCNIQQKTEPCPCQKSAPCDPCEKLQNMNK